MRVLDLYCGLGGASTGYALAGFEVVGVDLHPQPDYPFNFMLGDALRAPTYWLRDFDLIHASPPCQAYLTITNNPENHPRLYEATQELLQSTGVPYVIENPAARPDVVLCGEMFGLGVIRHRKFELGGWTMAQPPHVAHRGRVRGWRHGTFYDGPYVACYGKGGGKATLDEARMALDIDWATDRSQLIEALPPVYTEAIGNAFLAHLETSV